MTGTPPVVLDACVLANFSLRDTEALRLFEPKWSEEIIREATRTLESKLRWPITLTAHFEAELGAHFSEAWITGYDRLLNHLRQWEVSSVQKAGVDMSGHAQRCARADEERRHESRRGRLESQLHDGSAREATGLRHTGC